MNEIDLQNFPDREAADRALATEIASILVQGIEDRGQATLVVSGGSTPLQLFRYLSRTHLPWSRVNITLADERMVDANHPDSNARLVRENLMLNGAASARFHPLFQGDLSAPDEVEAAEKRVAKLGRTDVVVLGMGGDAHTASLFPNTSSLSTGLDMNTARHCIATTPPVAPYFRISQTLPALLNTGRIFLHIHGEKKLGVMKEAVREADSRRHPVSAFLLQKKTPLSVYYAD